MRGTVRLRYRVYAHEMSVRTNWVDEEFALLNGAATFITLRRVALRARTKCACELPRLWARSFSGMTPGSGANTFVAPDYDTLVDSPILAGTPAVHEFSVSGKPHYLVELSRARRLERREAAAGSGEDRGGYRAVLGRRALRSLLLLQCRRSLRSMRSSTGIRRSSTVPRESTTDARGLLEWLSHGVHEYFHAWNVKRLRPVELGPFDYENEVYTEALVCGRGHRLLRRPMLRAQASHRETNILARCRRRSARFRRPRGGWSSRSKMASFDAWIKYYRPDENSAEHARSATT